MKSIRTLQTPIEVVAVENGCRIVGPHRGGVEAIRKDGLRIFLDGDAVLDSIRVKATDPRAVILSVAMRRFQQIATNYAAKHAPELIGEIEAIVGKAMANSGETAVIAGILASPSTNETVSRHWPEKREATCE